MKKQSIKGQQTAYKAANYLQELCRPLEKHSCVQFSNDITFADGEIAMLMNDQRILDHYFASQPPSICTDKNGRTLKPGVYLGKVLKEQFEHINTIMAAGSFAQNSIHFMEREADSQHLYSFFFDLSENDFLQWTVNNLNTLADFIEHFRYHAHDLIIESMTKENRATLPLYEDFKPLHNSSQQRIIHQHSKQAMYLSKQQSACLRLLLQGNTAKEIALTLCLSPRTVEHYLARIKQLLGCKSQKELIAVYREQL